MNTPLTFSVGYALYAVNAAFKLEFAVRALAHYHETAFLKAAQFVFLDVDFFDFPAVLFRKHVVHTADFVGKQRRFFAACARADFDDNVFVVVGVLGQKQHLQLLGKFGNAFFLHGNVLVKHGKHVLVRFAADGFQIVRKLTLRLFVLFVGFHYGRKGAVLFDEFFPTVVVGNYFRLGDFFRKKVVSVYQFVKFVCHIFSCLGWIFLLAACFAPNKISECNVLSRYHHTKSA